MKYLRFYIIGGITVIGLIYILFIFKPKYLFKYKNSFTVKFDIEEIENYKWYYETENDNLKLSDSTDNMWIFIPSSNGSEKLTFYYKNMQKEDEEYKYKIVYDFNIEGKKMYLLTGMGFGISNFPFPY